MSLDKMGFMRENFDGETGEPLYADNFASWNILADLMPDYLRGGISKLPLFAFLNSEGGVLAKIGVSGG